jgi:hypothetical protein
MDKKKVVELGINSLIEKYRIAFRIPENLNYYMERDYQIAEKKFIKFALIECRLDFL